MIHRSRYVIGVVTVMIAIFVFAYAINIARF